MKLTLPAVGQVWFDLGGKFKIIKFHSDLFRFKSLVNGFISDDLIKNTYNNIISNYEYKVK